MYVKYLRTVISHFPAPIRLKKKQNTKFIRRISSGGKQELGDKLFLIIGTGFRGFKQRKAI